MNVTVIGTGYVGLTTGVTLAFLGHQVVGVDIAADKVACLNRFTVIVNTPTCRPSTITVAGLTWMQPLD